MGSVPFMYGLVGHVQQGLGFSMVQRYVSD